jgi:hypothetical protein
MPIMVMGLAVRQHVLQHYTGRARSLGVAGATFAAVLAAVVFLGQLIGKWHEGGWMALVSFSLLALVAHMVLLSPAGYREAAQVNRIVHDKARVEGGMASIVKWQAFKMQEYRFRMMIAISSLLELFGVGQMSPRRFAAALVGGGSVPVPPYMLLSAAHAGSGGPAPRTSAAAPEDSTSAFATRNYHLPPLTVRHRVLVPITGIHQGSLTALRYARSLSSDVTAVHVSMDRAETEALHRQWPVWGEGIRLVNLDSPHKMVLEPLLQYVQGMLAIRQHNEIITVVVPQSIRPRWWSNLMRTQMAVLLRLSLPFETGIVITDVPYLLDGDER